jgi:hypothetical protein
MKLKNIFLMNSQRSLMAAVFFASLLITSCKKEDSNIGLLVQPPEDAINGHLVDTFTLATYSRLDDSVRTDEASSNMLGSKVDAVFGKTTAGFVTQVRLSANNPVFDPSLVIDSVVLTLVYKEYYGSLSPQTFSVFQLSEQIHYDSSYYTNSQTAYTATDLVDPLYATQTPDFTNSFYDATLNDSVKPHLRLRLLNSFGQDIFNQSGTGNLADNNAFTTWFKGLYVTVSNPSQSVGEGAVMNIEMLDADTKLTIYYHDTSNAKFGFQMLINEFAARYTRVEHDYTGTPVEAVLNDSTLGMNNFYIQAGGGVIGEIMIPGLDALKNQSNIAINYAELIIPAQYFSLDPKTPVGRMIVYGLDEEGEHYAIKDLASLVLFGGFYDESTKQYKFVITRHIQDIVKGLRPNLGIRLLPEASAVSVKQSVLNGQNSLNRSKPYLKVIYTKF